MNCQMLKSVHALRLRHLAIYHDYRVCVRVWRIVHVNFLCQFTEFLRDLFVIFTRNLIDWNECDAHNACGKQLVCFLFFLFHFGFVTIVGWWFYIFISYQLFAQGTDRSILSFSVDIENVRGTVINTNASQLRMLFHFDNFKYWHQERRW